MQESTKYSLASLQLQVQVLCSLSEYEAHRLIWNRTVNRKGGAGNRVALDFHMENLVKKMKQALRHLGVNLNEETAQVESKALQGLLDVVESHNSDLGIKPPTSGHNIEFSQEDVATITDIVLGENMFSYQPGRKFDAYPKMTRPIMSGIDISKIKTWIDGHLKHLKYVSNKISAAE